METPSSTKRVTRSQTLAALSNTTNNSVPICRQIEDSGKGVSKSRRRNVKQLQDRSPLIDITNDSPIVGLAMGSLETPSSAIAKQRSSRAMNNTTPGSGEALLRGQVKTLLQKVEEEAVLSKLSLENCPFFHLQEVVNSSIGAVALTPANTPEDGGVENACLASVTPLPVVEEQLKVESDIFDGKKQESLESQKSLTRSLLLDFSEKSDTSYYSECSSVLTYQGIQRRESECKDESSPTDDDRNASIWSIHVNASAHNEDEEDYYDHEEEEEDYDDDEEEENGGSVDELCEGIRKISVNEKTGAKFTGKHTKFVYNSDDEIVEVVESENSGGGGVSPSVLRLKGLPTPEGRHLRFPMEQEV